GSPKRNQESIIFRSLGAWSPFGRLASPCGLTPAGPEARLGDLPHFAVPESSAQVPQLSTASSPRVGDSSKPLMRTLCPVPPGPSRILGHARTSMTLDTYEHLFEQARHSAEVRAELAQSEFAMILSQATLAPTSAPRAV